MRPTTANTYAYNRFNPNVPTTYIARYTDGTVGPERSTREAAERDFRDANSRPQQRSLIERFGLDSSVFHQWSRIHPDYRSTSGGERTVLTLDTKTGATVLATWIGPL